MTEKPCSFVIVKQHSIWFQSSVSWKDQTHRDWLLCGKGQGAGQGDKVDSCQDSMPISWPIN